MYDRHMLHVMVMAGGKGTRFWPLSRLKKAKQFLTMIGDKPLIDYTLDRVVDITKKEHRWVLGNSQQKEQLQHLNDYVLPENILQEPFGKNTAACIGWGAFEKKRPRCYLCYSFSGCLDEPQSAFQPQYLMQLKRLNGQ